MGNSFFKLKPTHIKTLIDGVLNKFQKECQKKKISFHLKIDEDLMGCYECYEEELKKISQYAKGRTKNETH